MGIGVLISKKSTISIIPYISGLAVLFCSLLLLSDLYGLAGVGYAVMASQLTTASMTTFCAQLVHRINWNYRPAVNSITIILLAGALIQMAGSKTSIALGMMLVSLSTASGWLVILKENDRQYIRNYALNWLQKMG